MIAFYTFSSSSSSICASKRTEPVSCSVAPTQLEIIHSVILRSRGHSKMIAYPLDPLQGQCPLCAQWLLRKKRENNRFHQYG